MAKLIYAAIASLDGFVEDEDGKFDWAVPDDEVHAFVNELERRIGTHLYGRRMYEVMVAWENAADFVGDSAVMRDYAAIWQAAEKVVYSRTLVTPTSARTRVEPEFDPEEVGQMKALATADLGIGGSELAAVAIAAGLVDEIHLLLTPVAVGAGKRALPAGVRLDLELLGERRFGNGVVHLHYRAGRD